MHFLDNCIIIKDLKSKRKKRKKKRRRRKKKGKFETSEVEK